MTKYTEIFKLKKMLEEAKIPFEFYKNNKSWLRIVYKPDKKGNFKCGVVQGCISYGGQQGFLEIMGLLTAEEERQGSVVGWLTAEEVFKRIKEDWENDELRKN